MSKVFKNSNEGWRFAILYFLSFSAISIYTIYGSLYFKRRGISNVQIGILNAIPAWVGIFAHLIWGLISDTLRQRKLPNFLVHLVTAIIYPLFWFWGDQFLLTCVIMGFFTFFFTPAIPLADTWTLDHLSNRGGDYGRIRTWGSIGFALPLLLSTFLLSKTKSSSAEDLLPTFLGFCIFRVISALYLLTLPDYHSSLSERRKPNWKGLRSYLTPFAVTFFFATFMSRFLFSPYYTFFSIFLDEQGIADNFKGMFWVMAVVSEAGLIAVSGVLLRRFGEMALLIAGLAAMAFRMFVYSTEPSWYIILATQTLHALTFGAFHVASIQIINTITPKDFRASGQTFNGALLGTGSLIGGIVSGILAESYGLAGLFRIQSVISLVSTVIIGLLMIRFKRYYKRVSAHQGS